MALHSELAGVDVLDPSNSDTRTIRRFRAVVLGMAVFLAVFFFVLSMDWFPGIALDLGLSGLVWGLGFGVGIIGFAAFASRGAANLLSNGVQTLEVSSRGLSGIRRGGQPFFVGWGDASLHGRVDEYRPGVGPAGLLSWETESGRWDAALSARGVKTVLEEAYRQGLIVDVGRKIPGSGGRKITRFRSPRLPSHR
jgi:hypothetical protein